MYRDRYQEALRELIEAKMKGLTVKPRWIAARPPVIDLMVTLKTQPDAESIRFEARSGGPKKANKTAPDRQPGPLAARPGRVGSGKHRPQSSPPLLQQGGASGLDAHLGSGPNVSVINLSASENPGLSCRGTRSSNPSSSSEESTNFRYLFAPHAHLGRSLVPRPFCGQEYRAASRGSSRRRGD
jgi:hypothetical protein